MTWDKGQLLEIAVRLAAEAHHGQLDRNGEPYILHPLAVMNLLTPGDEELLATAVLHDVVEDNSENG